MTKSTGEIRARVVSVLPLARFEGEAVVAHVDPKYVVALMLDESKQTYTVPGTDVTLPTHQVVFFAIHSVAQLFARSDVEGETFRLRVEMETVDGAKRYRLARVV